MSDCCVSGDAIMTWSGHTRSDTFSQVGPTPSEMVCRGGEFCRPTSFRRQACAFSLAGLPVKTHRAGNFFKVSEKGGLPALGGAENGCGVPKCHACQGGRNLRFVQ